MKILPQTVEGEGGRSRGGETPLLLRLSAVLVHPWGCPSSLAIVRSGASLGAGVAPSAAAAWVGYTAAGGTVCPWMSDVGLRID